MTGTKEKMTTAKALTVAFTDRQALAMLLLGIASGLPYAAVGGTLNAWLSAVGVDPSTVGLLTWALLAYAFKFLWAAVFQNRKTPFGLKTGPRRFFMLLFILLIVGGLFCLAFSDPPNNLGRIAFIAVIVAVFSASFDIVVAAWRIEVAKDDLQLDILSSVEQFGYRTASFLGGFIALIMADNLGWQNTFFFLTGIMALTALGVFIAKPSPLADKPLSKAETETANALVDHLSQQQRVIATALVLMGWAVGFWLIADFMHGSLTDPENHSGRDFIKHQGPVVILTTVVWLGLVSAFLVIQNDRHQNRDTAISPNPGGFLGIMFQAILEPMIELIGRLRWASILVLLVVLSYRFTDLIWGGFAYWFYLGEDYGALGHTLTEVGFASKLMGVIATIVGIGIGGIAMLRFGRMPVFFIGAVLAALTNLLFADLAVGAHFTDSFLSLTQLDHLYALFGLDIRIARLTTVIFAENLAVGLASAASVAYISSIVNKSYAAVQYALLVSLVMLLGVLGRPAIGEIIETQGFAKAFIICALLGGVAAILALFEWIRTARADKAKG